MTDSERLLRRKDKVLCTCSSCRLCNTRHPVTNDKIAGQFVNKKSLDAHRLTDQIKALTLSDDALVSATLTSNEHYKDTVTTSRSHQSQEHGPSNVQGESGKSSVESDHHKGEPSGTY